MAHNLLPDECVLGDVTREAGSERDGVGLDIETGLHEGDRRVLEVELATGRERVVDAVHAERLSSAVSVQPSGSPYALRLRTSRVDSGWKLSTTRSGLISRTWRVVCFKLPKNGAAVAAVAHTIARKTERKKLFENFMAEFATAADGLR